MRARFSQILNSTKLIFVLLLAVTLAACTSTEALRVDRIAPPSNPITDRFVAIVVDARTGETLFEHKADETRYPASLTKMMTLYLTFNALKQGIITRDTPIVFSQNASRQPPSKIGVKAGDSLTVDEIIRALVVKSGNDAAMAIAEHLGGSESGFASLMTRQARALRMNRTVFTNPSGLPDSDMISTVREMATLSLALRRDFPEYYSYFRLQKTTVAGKDFTGHNRVLGSLRGADGLKTGYTRAAGFNLATSVQYNGRSVVAVIMGEDKSAIRDARMTSLVSQALPKASSR